MKKIFPDQIVVF